MRREHRLFAALYDRLTAPAERNGLADLRRELVNPLRGDVVELGAGTGANLRYYGAVRTLTLVEPDGAMARRLQVRAAEYPQLPIVIRTATLEEVGMLDQSVDAVVCTLVLCSVADPVAVLTEVRRILRPDGVLVLVEHVRHATTMAALVQSVLTPLQRLVAGGCRLDRPTGTTLARAGFDLSEVRPVGVLSRLPLLSSAIAGRARPAGAVG